MVSTIYSYELSRGHDSEKRGLRSAGIVRYINLRGTSFIYHANAFRSIEPTNQAKS